VVPVVRDRGDAVAGLVPQVKTIVSNAVVSAMSLSAQAK